jgi:hypothetical protein
MGNYGFPETLLMTAHTRPLAEMGQRYSVVETTNFGGRLGRWEVIYYRAYSACTLGQVVAMHQQDITATSGSTTTCGHGAVAGNVADYLVGGVLHVTDDGGGAGAAPEGEYGIITANTTTLITFTPALSAGIANTDTVTVSHPFLGQQGAATSGMAVIGLCLATLAAGEYGFALRKGFYPAAEVVDTDALAIGSGLAAAATGQFIEYDVATHTLSGPIATVMAARPAAEAPAGGESPNPIYMTLP